MKKEYISTGKTLDDAILTGCQALGVDRDVVSIEVLETPSRGFLGIGAQDAKIRLTYELTPGDKAATFLGEVLTAMGLPASVDAQPGEGELSVKLSGENMGLIIGRRGETLDALQYLTSLVINRGEEEYLRVALDTEDYRAKRADTLIRLAKRLAAKVVKFRHNITLEPMNPYERRIIHSTLQDFKGVTTFSTGTEPARKVVIAYAAPKRGEGYRSTGSDIH